MKFLTIYNYHNINDQSSFIWNFGHCLLPAALQRGLAKGGEFICCLVLGICNFNINLTIR